MSDRIESSRIELGRVGSCRGWPRLSLTAAGGQRAIVSFKKEGDKRFGWSIAGDGDGRQMVRSPAKQQRARIGKMVMMDRECGEGESVCGCG